VVEFAIQRPEIDALAVAADLIGESDEELIWDWLAFCQLAA
jgi:hypothetical protein